MDRRRFLKVSTTLSGGLALGINLSGCTHKGSFEEGSFKANAWLTVPEDGPIAFEIGQAEMGQGIATGFAIMICEELDYPVDKLAIKPAKANSKFNHPQYMFQTTGGSTSTSAFWEVIREAGATARELIKKAASEKWSVPLSECSTHMGFVLHEKTKKKEPYASFAKQAAGVSVGKVELKKHKDFKFIGKPFKRVDVVSKTTGTADFGIDSHPKDALKATVLHAPVKGATVKKIVNEAEIKKIKGVKHIFPISNGVAIVAEKFWQAKSALEKLQVDWNKTENDTLSTKAIIEKTTQQVKQSEGDSFLDEGSVTKIKEASKAKVGGIYSTPVLAHATMEPQTCAIKINEDSAELWVPTQSPGLCHAIVSNMTGISRKNVVVHGTFLGGGFGRRLEADFVIEAVQIVQKAKAPIHLLWTREEDMKNDFFRPLAVANVEAHINANNEFSLEVDLGTQNLAEREFEDWAPGLFPALSGGMSRGIGSLIGKISSGQFAKEGLANTDYAFENFDFRWSEISTNIPGGSWRSVGHSITGFLVESIVDEIAHKLKQDPIAFRKKYLAKHPRHIAVLTEVEKMSGWGKRKLPAGHALGVAVHKSFGSVVAEVAEVSFSEGTIKVHEVYSAIHCGTPVNPDGIKAQMEGGIIFALSAALHGEITYEKGQVVQSNFHDYPVVRMSESPNIQVKIIDSDADPTGVGEPGVPPLAAAVANALFTASGKRVRHLPLQKHIG